MQFPWNLLKHNCSMVSISAMIRHKHGAVWQTLYCCDLFDVIELEREYWIVLSSYGYHVMLERLHDGYKESFLPTTGCIVIGNASTNKQEKDSCWLQKCLQV